MVVSDLEIPRQLVVFLADARVGAELRKAQEAGQLATQADHGKGIQSSDRSSDTRVTLEEIGIPRQRASEMKRLAEVGEPDFANALASGQRRGC